jgi:acyl-homoserine lactone acylase PvdQ
VHGPVQVRAGATAYARRYAIWNRELETLVGLDKLNRAQNIQEVDQAMREVTWNENVVAADSQGNIGFWHPGLHPLRPMGFDERLPYAGTGEAEWRGLLDRSQTPHVINPKQGFVFSWNNPPSAGWTAGDAPARERLTGRFHRAGWLQRIVRKLAKNPTFEGAQDAIRRAGTTAQQRPLARGLLVRAQRRSTGNAKAILDALLRWDGNYARTDGDGTVDPGVAIWEQLKTEAETIAVDRFGGAGAKPLLGATSTSHEFDITNGEAFGLRSLSRAGLRRAAEATFGKLAKKFGTDDLSKWRDTRKMYKVAAQGAGSAPPLPFFDRGTWEQVVEVGP